MFFTEVLVRTGHALSEQGVSWLWVLTAGAVAVLPQARRFWARADVRWGSFALVVVLGARWAWSLVWASDDAYVSFRYARHLVEGHGLVFNVGERVEGYTDFLWTVLVAGFLRLGAPAGESAILLSLAAFVVLLAVVWRLAERLSPAGSHTLPVAAALTASSYTMASFATSGLETVLAALFVLTALAAAESRRPVLAGTLAVLAMLCHPDHLLFYVGLGGAWALSCRSWRERADVGLRFAAPFLLLFVPYFLWRWHYYGDFFPNTYYAKSAALAYFRRGGAYLLFTFVSAGLWATLPLAALGAWRLRGSITGWFAILALPLYLVYVAKIGGDFMLGRLYVPVLPVGFLLVEVGLRTLLVREPSLSGRATTMGLALLAASAALPLRVLEPREIFRGIADERTFYPLSRFSPLASEAGGYELGQALHAEFVTRGLEPKVAIVQLGMASFFSGLPIYDLLGLTSRDVAHLPLVSRGRPGHEKLASPGMVLESGSVLSELDVYPAPYDELGRAVIGGFPFAVVRFEPSIAPTLLEHAGLLDYRRHLDDRLPGLAVLSAQDPARAACDLWHMRSYYFSANDDGARQRALASALAPHDPEGMALWQGWLSAARGSYPAGWRRLEEHGSRYDAWRASGEAAAWRVLRTPPRQSPPSARARELPFVDSFSESGGEASTGELVSPSFVLQGDALTLELGGGLLPAEAHLDLLIDGQKVASATGCGADVWGARLWDVRRYRGRNATLAIVDSSAGPWGHIEVGAIEEWSVSTPSP
jgi:hypothetical protein